MATKFVRESIDNWGLFHLAFEKIIGNDNIKLLLKETISRGIFLHSYLFVGEAGIGKMLFAKEFAKYILSAGEITNELDLQIEENNHPDFKIIKPDGNSIKIEQVRMLQNKIVEKPIASARKVYIIDNCHTMTKEAQNCLLKTLEEPPEYATIILICSNESLLLNTIQSRCTKISFQKISKQELKKYLQEHELFSNISDSMIEAINGSIGKAYELKEQQELYESIRPIFLELASQDKIDIIRKSENLYKAKDNIQDVLNYANVILFEQAKKDSKFLNCIKYVEKAKNKLKQNANFDMTIDDLLFHLWEEIHENYNRS